MKDPDGVGDAIRRAACDSVAANGITDDKEIETLIELREEKIKEVTKRWFEFDEYLTLEIDTEAKTITVLPSGTE